MCVTDIFFTLLLAIALIITTIILYKEVICGGDDYDKELKATAMILFILTMIFLFIGLLIVLQWLVEFFLLK